MERQQQGRPQKRLHDETFSPKLDDLGINKIQSHRWQREAAVAVKEYHELQVKLEGQAKGGTRTDLGHTVTEVGGWSYQKTADDFGVSKAAVIKNIKIADAVEEYRL